MMIKMGDRKCLRSRFCDCVCVRRLCWDHWRMWCKPLIILIICLMVLFAMLPLLIYELYWKHANEWFTAWFVSGILVLFTFLIFLLGLMQHLFNYTQPQLQKHIIRILWMVPIYSLNSWLGLMFPEAAVYLDTARECYEAYVLYNFLCYLLNFLHREYDLNEELEAKHPIGQPVPFCCCPPWPKGARFVRWCKIGVLQYTAVRIFLTLIALITQLCKVYDKGHLRLDRAFLYIGLIECISYFIAMYSLIYFYGVTKNLLKPLNPVIKFISIEIIFFLFFWQRILIVILVILVRVKDTSDSWSQYNEADIAEAFYNFIVCIEMPFFAIAHYFVFSHKPYIDPAATQAPCIHSCLRMLDVRDVAGDMKEHFVDPIPRPNFNRIRRCFGYKNGESTSGVESENDPLLNLDSLGEDGSGGGGEDRSSNNDGLSEGSVSSSVMTYDRMKEQERLTIRTAVSAVEEESEFNTAESLSSGSVYIVYNDSGGKSTPTGIPIDSTMA